MNLRESLDKHDCSNVAYVFMPDHAHILLKGNNLDSNVLKAIKLFKQKTGFTFSKNNYSFKWQKDFYDHILRSNEDIKKHIRYVLENPIRKGLTDTIENYPFLGSLNYSLEELVTDADCGYQQDKNKYNKERKHNGNA